MTQFHARVRVVRYEEWTVEAETKDQADHKLSVASPEGIRPLELLDWEVLGSIKSEDDE